MGFSKSSWCFMRGNFNIFSTAGNGEFHPLILKTNEGRTCVRPSTVTRLNTPSPRALRRATRPTWGRCPSRVASKTSMPILNGQRNFYFLLIRPSWRKIVQTIFNYFFRFKSTVGNQMVTSSNYTNNCLVTNYFFQFRQIFLCAGASEEHAPMA